MGDVASGTGSSVAQTYLKEVLENFFSFSQSVRLAALSVVATILRQGLTHPVQTVPYLIAMQTDCDPASRVKAEAQLQEIENKFPGFTNVIPLLFYSNLLSYPILSYCIGYCSHCNLSAFYDIHHKVIWKQCESKIFLNLSVHPSFEHRSKRC